MLKIIRVCVAGSESAGKTFLIGGITKVFNENNIFKNLKCSLHEVVKKNKRKGITDIDNDIATNITSGVGTPRQVEFLNGEYICDIKDGDKKARILFRNIPGEMFNFYFFDSLLDGNNINKVFENFIGEDKKRLNLVNHLKNKDIKQNWLEYRLSKKRTIVQKIEELKIDFEEYIKQINTSYYNDNSIQINQNFYSFLFYYVSTDFVICFNPTLSSGNLMVQQNNLMGRLNDKKIIDETKNIYKVITQFDTYFANPNSEYINEKITTIEDYLNLSLKKVKTLINIRSNNLKTDDFSSIINSNANINCEMWSILQEYFKVGIDNNVLLNVFLVCTKYRNTDANRFPDFFGAISTSAGTENSFTASNYKSISFPLGCFELIVSLLMKNKIVKPSTLGINIDNDKYEPIIKAYFQ